jgi:hypothetical protein
MGHKTDKRDVAKESPRRRPLPPLNMASTDSVIRHMSEIPDADLLAYLESMTHTSTTFYNKLCAERHRRHRIYHELERLIARQTRWLFEKGQG